MAAASAAGSSGATLTGHVALQAFEPVCGKSSCATPARSLTLHFRAGHRAVKLVRTDRNGDFRIALPAGIYSVSTRATEAGPEATITPARIRLRVGQRVKLTFVYRPGRP